MKYLLGSRSARLLCIHTYYDTPLLTVLKIKKKIGMVCAQILNSNFQVRYVAFDKLGQRLITGISNHSRWEYVRSSERTAEVPVRHLHLHHIASNRPVLRRGLFPVRVSYQKRFEEFSQIFIFSQMLLQCPFQTMLHEKLDPGFLKEREILQCRIEIL